MTGPEHYALAEVILEDTNREVDAFPSDRFAQAMAEAQVHATLALAAATALGREGADGTMPSRDRAQWFAAAAEPAPKLSELPQYREQVQA